MEKSYLPKKSKDYIDSVLKLSIHDPELLLKNATHLLANITNFAVISTTVFTEKNYIKNVKLVQISKFTAMIILTISSGVIKNQLFRCEYPLIADTLNTVNNFLNEKFNNVLLSKITPAFIQTVAASLGEMTFFMSDIFSFKRLTNSTISFSLYSRFSFFI